MENINALKLCDSTLSLFNSIMLESIPGKIFVVGVVCLICFIAYSSQLCIFIPAYETSDSILLLVPFNILVLFVFYNYYLAVTTDPGKIPTNWVNYKHHVNLLAYTNAHKGASFFFNSARDSHRRHYRSKILQNMQDI